MQLTKGEAGYIGDPGVRIHCASCKFFNAPNGCGVVRGTIDPDGCCNLWTEPGHDARFRWASGSRVRETVD